MRETNPGDLAGTHHSVGGFTFMMASPIVPEDDSHVISAEELVAKIEAEIEPHRLIVKNGEKLQKILRDGITEHFARELREEADPTPTLF